MGLPKEKKAAVTGASLRLRRAGPVPPGVYGNGEPVAKGADLVARLKKEAGLPEHASEKEPPAGFGIPDPDALFGQALDELRGRGTGIPSDLSRLDAAGAESLERALDALAYELAGDPVLAERFREFFRSKFRELREAGRKEKAIMALADVVAAAEGFRQAVAEGRLTCEDLPYAARQKLSEIFFGLDGRGFGDAAQEAELKAQLAAQQEEIMKLRAAVSVKDPETAALEAEVEAMLAAGVPPERYGERLDRKEKPPEFLRRVYGKYLEKGREAFFLFQLRKLDPKFGKSLDTYCWKEGIPAESLIPTKRLMADRALAAAGGEDGVRRAVNAVSRRRQLAAKKAADA